MIFSLFFDKIIYKPQGVSLNRKNQSFWRVHKIEIGPLERKQKSQMLLHKDKEVH